MPPSLTFTGERFLPQCAGEIVYEHWHRYVLASTLAPGRRVLDVACGEGYGAALLARKASFVLGVDLAREAVDQARERYAQAGRCAFAQGSCQQVPAATGAFDLIVSFETIEHVDAQAQEAMLAEFDRTLAPGGLIILSSPNKALYSDATGYQNEYHVHELYRDDLANLVARRFPAQLWLGQKVQTLSTIWNESPSATGLSAYELGPEGVLAYRGPEPLYFLVALARRAEDLPCDLPALSLLVDRGETVHTAAERAQRELLRLESEYAERHGRLEALIAERDTSLERRSQHVLHLERLKENCERVVAERDGQLRSANAHVQHLEALVAARERLVEERDAQLATHSRLLREEQNAHARLVIELRETLQTKADLSSTLSGLEAERAKLLQEVHEFRERLSERERQVTDLQNMVAERDAQVRYRQSLRWWLKLPFARIKMALQKR